MPYNLILLYVTCLMYMPLFKQFIWKAFTILCYNQILEKKNTVTIGNDNVLIVVLIY